MASTMPRRRRRQSWSTDSGGDERGNPARNRSVRPPGPRPPARAAGHRARPGPSTSTVVRENPPVLEERMGVGRVECSCRRIADVRDEASSQSHRVPRWRIRCPARLPPAPCAPPAGRRHRIRRARSRRDCACSARRDCPARPVTRKVAGTSRRPACKPNNRHMPLSAPDEVP